MTFFLQLVIAGISLGMIYALIALGFVIILKCSAAFNIAQGHFVMLGGYLGFTFLVTYHWPIWLSIILAIAIAVVMGLIIERLALRPLLGQPVLAVVMMTVALANVIGGVATLIWGGIFQIGLFRSPAGNLPKNRLYLFAPGVLHRSGCLGRRGNSSNADFSLYQGRPGDESDGRR